MQINMNGFISFSKYFQSYTPYPFPHYNGLNVDFLGAFWADADSSQIRNDQNGNGVVYYHIYQYIPIWNLPPSSHQRVFDMATRDGQT